MKNFTIKTIITWFGCGLVPIAPGTAGSIGTLPLAFLILNQNYSVPILAILAAALTVIAIFFVSLDQKTTTARDPSYVVIDESAGILWSIVSLPLLPGFQEKISFSPRQSLILGFCFLSFRILDVVKPFPAGYFDARSKVAVGAVPRGAYIVLDDVVAGIYTSILAWILFSFVF